MEAEIWKSIEGFENYQVSNLGRIKSVERKVKHKGGYRTVKERILKPTKDTKGYLQVSLWKDGKGKMMKVHRLVAMAFLPNPQNLPMINHRDEDRTSNVVTNLEYCTAAYNNNYGKHNERVAKANTNGKCSKVVYQYSLEGELIRIWPSASEVERETGYSNSHICECCNGKFKTMYNYKWSYVPINS